MCSTNDEKEPIVKYTYERIKRVINGYKNGNKDVPG